MRRAVYRDADLRGQTGYAHSKPSHSIRPRADPAERGRTRRPSGPPEASPGTAARMDDSAAARPGTGERWWSFAAAVLFAGLAIVMAATFLDYGITWDEEYQRIYGDIVLRWYTSLFSDRAAVIDYAHLGERRRSLLRRSLRPRGAGRGPIVAARRASSRPGTSSTPPWASPASSEPTKLGALLGGARSGVLAAVLLGSTPAYYGHAFSNPKDIPFAALHAWVLVLALSSCASAPRVRLAVRGPARRDHWPRAGRAGGRSVRARLRGYRVGRCCVGRGQRADSVRRPRADGAAVRGALRDRLGDPARGVASGPARPREAPAAGHPRCESHGHRAGAVRWEDAPPERRAGLVPADVALDHAAGDVVHRAAAAASRRSGASAARTGFSGSEPECSRSR